MLPVVSKQIPLNSTVPSMIAVLVLKLPLRSLPICERVFVPVMAMSVLGVTMVKDDSGVSFSKTSVIIAPSYRKSDVWLVVASPDAVMPTLEPASRYNCLSPSMLTRA